MKTDDMYFVVDAVTRMILEARDKHRQKAPTPYIPCGKYDYILAKWEQFCAEFDHLREKDDGDKIDYVSFQTVVGYAGAVKEFNDE